ncbi:hypothetical protein GALMADRAFT_135439 [Galerina marginata CBS 339.88]|uniref:Mixed lineage kinase domain-containing protein n=1 Tax=Galerina marginata (strain CBS 339.88) TaxID=685588 RepID=A0A067TI99_GALM3|nr:hypothetical protein GALMADRAFT_135439 [Galerina marginata CBS 339.88]
MNHNLRTPLPNASHISKPTFTEKMDYNGMHRDLHGPGGLARGPTRTGSGSLADTAGNVVDPMVNNPAIGTAMQVLDSLSDIGKALPFIAPAFVLLKIIIDLEKRAQDVDAKCTDLVERITFMLSHLPALQDIEIMAPTRQVIDRMNDSLKDAASLIAAYRKQSRVARRLSLSNRDKFTTCAQSINNCCRDLLMSLQIHQTVQLDILTRAVPIDEEDKAARTFVEEHGGSVDAVMHDRELVKEFAKQQKLVMDDSVMEQLSANIADSVQQNHVRLEGILRDNVSSAISDGLKSLALEMSSLEAEQKFVCIQCNKEFTNYTNGSLACSYHRGEYDSWRKNYPCCSTPNPCQFGAHRAKHHSDYPYGNFFPRARAITGYVDTNTVWASVEDTNLESDEVQKASVGQLHRWVSRGAPVEENTLLVIVGRVWYTNPYYFNTFTAKELEDIAKSVRLSRRTLIFRTSTDDNEYALAEWILSISGKITGVRLSAKTATSANPWVRVCPIDLATCTKSGDILTPSEGGMRSYIPASPYVLPETISHGPILNDTQTRLVRTNFKTRASPSLRVILKTMTDPPLVANPNTAGTKFDYFVGKVSVFNNNAPGSLNPVTISSVAASYRMVGDPDYAPAEECKLIDGLELPVTVDPRQSLSLNFQVMVPRTEEDSKQEIRWFNRAFLARHRPVRIKLIVEDIEGEQCSLVLEHVAKPYPLKRKSEKDLGFFFFDNPLPFERNCLQVEPVDSKTEVVKIGGNAITVKRLEKVVYQALKTGQTEVDLKIGQEKDSGEWEWAAWALVDISCRRVYAFKVMLNEGKKVPVKRLGTLGYVLCPDYGDVVNKTRPISYATETVKLPPMEPYPVKEYVQDDNLDDFKPPVPPKPATPVVEVPPVSLASLGAGAASIPIPAELTNRLASIDTNLARIAAALEKLVAVMPGSSANGHA